MNRVGARGFVPVNGSVKPDAGVHPPSTARLNGVIPATPPHAFVRGDLHEFERLIDRAWADYAAASIGAAAAQTPSGTAASNVEQPSAPSAATVARTVRPFRQNQGARRGSSVTGYRTVRRKPYCCGWRRCWTRSRSRPRHHPLNRQIPQSLHPPVDNPVERVVATDKLSLAGVHRGTGTSTHRRIGCPHRFSQGYNSCHSRVHPGKRPPKG